MHWVWARGYPPPPLPTNLSHIYLVLEPASSCPRGGEDGSAVAIGILIDDFYGLQKTKKISPPDDDTNLTSSRVSTLIATRTGPNISSV